MPKTKLSLRQNAKKCICLYSNVTGTTPVVINHYVDLKGSEDFIKKEFHAIKGNNKNYFSGNDKISRHNDLQLKNLKFRFDEIAEEHPEFTKPKQIVDYYLGKDVRTKEEKPLTLNAFFNERIAYIKDVEASTNFKNYVTARNTIEEISPELSNKHLKDITRGDIARFQEILIQKKPTSFPKTMKALQATITNAKEKEYNNNNFVWNWKSTRNYDKKVAHQYIEPEKLEAAFNIDIDSIKGKMPYEKCKMYLDIVKLMFYTGSRPIDTIQFNLNNVDNRMWVYVPEKKSLKASKGHSPKLTKTFLKDEALTIVNEYKENACNGFIFPVISNKKTYSTPIKRKKILNKIESEINSFLKKVGKNIGIEKLTMYDFRTTRITKLVGENNIPIPVIASMCGTSEKMLYNHYISKDNLADSFIQYF